MIDNNSFHVNEPLFGGEANKKIFDLKLSINTLDSKRKYILFTLIELFRPMYMLYQIFTNYLQFICLIKCESSLTVVNRVFIFLFLFLFVCIFLTD